VLSARGYRTSTAASGEEALARIAADLPDLVLLDVMMPGMNGYDVCRAIRADPACAVLPVVLVTALDPEHERVKGLEAGADDFLSKPIHQAELMARVRSLLRVKALYDEVQRQRAELQAWNLTLEQRVADAARQLERVGQLKRFFSPQLAQAILAGGADDPLQSHRREITVVFLDLRGFTAFTETADPEEVMAVLGQYHAAMGRLVLAHEGTLERFSGDGMMIFFNDPLPVPDAPERAVRMAVRMQQEMHHLSSQWRRRGYDLHMGIGIAQGLRDHRQHRFRRAYRLRGHRNRDQLGRAPVRRSGGWRDPAVAARPGRLAGGAARRRVVDPAGGRAVAQGLSAPGAGMARGAGSLSRAATRPAAACAGSQGGRRAGVT
jgi:adenylate cyclase